MHESLLTPSNVIMYGREVLGLTFDPAKLPAARGGSSRGTKRGSCHGRRSTTGSIAPTSATSGGAYYGLARSGENL